MPVRGVSSISRRPGVAQPSQRGLDVGHLVGDVVQARARAWRGTCPTGVSSRERREQLDVALADVEQHGLDALLRDRLAVHERHAVGVACGASIAASRSATATPMWSMRPNTARECTLERACGSPSSPTAASGGGLDPAPLAARCARTAPRSRCRARAGARARRGLDAGPHRGRRRRRHDRPVGRARRAARRAAGGDPDRHRQRLRARPRAARRPARGGARWPPPARALRPLELGRLADGRPFVNVASAGLASRRRTPRAAAQVAPRPARLRRRRRCARPRPSTPLRVRRARRRRARSSTAAPGR